MDKKSIARIFGVVFLLIGILGFFNDPVLGIFDVDTMHNIVHIVSGIAGLALSTSEENAALYGKIFGVVYGLVTLMGFVMGEGQMLGMMTINSADNVLHLVLTAGLLYLGFVRTKKAKA